MSNRTLKGFFGIPDLEDNNPNYVARFGELSTESATSSRDLRVYAKKAVYPYPTLIAFSYKDEFGAQFPTNPSTTWQDYVLSIGQWIAERYVAGQIPTDADRDRFWSQITAEFPNAIWEGMGTISNMPNTVKYMPEWISFTLDDGGYPISTKVWLSDPVFQNEFDEWETAVIPPADPIDLVQQNFSIVSSIVQQRDNIKTINDLVNDAKKNVRDGNKLDPETKTATVQIRWYDPTDPAVTMLHTFTLVHWGMMGIQYDNQKAAIRDYIEKNSTKTNWPKIYPELYDETDFAVIPTWTNMAVKPNATDIGLFSSSVPTGTLQDVMKKFAPSGFGSTDNYDLFIKTNCSATSVLYRGMQTATMGSPNNKDQKFKLTDVYPDYMNIPTDNADFSRMFPATQTFVKTLNQAIDIAYRVNANNTIPAGFSKQQRNGRLYVSFVSGGYQWLILSRQSYLAGI